MIIAALDEFAEICNVANRDDVFVAEALSNKDNNADGKLDYILDLGKLACGGGQNMFCGAGGKCSFNVYASDGAGYAIGEYLGYGAYFGDDAVLSPCAESDDPWIIRYGDGKMTVVRSCE